MSNCYIISNLENVNKFDLIHVFKPTFEHYKACRRTTVSLLGRFRYHKEVGGNITGHNIGSDRFSTNYWTTDPDSKLAIFYRIWLHINPAAALDYL